MDAIGSNNEEAAMGMFVTKHEVLMLRRVMDAKQMGDASSKKWKKGNWRKGKWSHRLSDLIGIYRWRVNLT